MSRPPRRPPARTSAGIFLSEIRKGLLRRSAGIVAVLRARSRLTPWRSALARRSMFIRRRRSASGCGRSSGVSKNASHGLLFGQGEFQSEDYAAAGGRWAAGLTWFQAANWNECCGWIGRQRSRSCFRAWARRREEMQAALKAGILLFNVESESELWALAECAAQLRKTARIAFRVNPDVAGEHASLYFDRVAQA